MMLDYLIRDSQIYFIFFWSLASKESCNLKSLSVNNEKENFEIYFIFFWSHASRESFIFNFFSLFLMKEEVCLSVPYTSSIYTHVCLRHCNESWILSFWKEGQLHMPGKLSLEAWSSLAGDTVVHRIAVAGQGCSDSRQTIPELPAEVLEMRLRGGGPGS